MTEQGDVPIPELRIAQSELKRFQGLVVELAGKIGRTRIKEYPIQVDGEAKIAEVSKTAAGKSTKVRLRDVHASGKNNEYVYESIFCREDNNGTLYPLYLQGSLTRNKLGLLVDSTWNHRNPGTLLQGVEAFVTGVTMRRTIEGQPIDEFRKMMSVLEQVKQQKESTVLAKMKGLIWKR